MSDHQLQPEWLSEPKWLEFLWKLRTGGRWDATPEQLSYFDDLLGMPVLSGLRRLEQADLIVKPTPRQHLNTFTVKDLKPVLKSHGLKVSGKKAELIERILENLPPEKLPEAEPNLFVLSDEARKLALTWHENKKQKKAKAIQAVLAHIETGDLEAAVEVVFAHEREQVFQRGINCDWNSKSFKQSQLERCREILTCPVRALDHLSQEERSRLLAVSATLALIGQSHDEWIKDHFEDDPHLADDKLLLAPSNYLSYRHQVERAKEIGWKVQLHTSVAEQRGCSFCTRLNGLIYEPDEAPELPFPECPIEGPCMAMYTNAHELESLKNGQNLEPVAERALTQTTGNCLPGEIDVDAAKRLSDNWAGFLGLVIGAIAILLALLLVQNI